MMHFLFICFFYLMFWEEVAYGCHIILSIKVLLCFCTPLQPYTFAKHTEIGIVGILLITLKN